MRRAVDAGERGPPPREPLGSRGAHLVPEGLLGEDTDIVAAVNQGPHDREHRRRVAASVEDREDELRRFGARVGGHRQPPIRIVAWAACALPPAAGRKETATFSRPPRRSSRRELAGKRTTTRPEPLAAISALPEPTFAPRRAALATAVPADPASIRIGSPLASSRDALAAFIDRLSFGPPLPSLRSPPRLAPLAGCSAAAGTSAGPQSGLDAPGARVYSRSVPWQPPRSRFWATRIAAPSEKAMLRPS